MKIITNSACNTWCLCEQRYCWKYEYGLRPNGNNNFPLSVGSKFHEGVDHLLANGSSEQSLDEAKHSILSRDRFEEDEEDALKTARFMLDRYWEYWVEKGNPWVEVVSTEETMGYPFRDDYWYFGKVDGLVRDETGNLWILEHKSTYSIDQNYLSKTKLDGQITKYMLMVREVFGVVPDGVIYNIVCRPRKYQRKGESTDHYLERCTEEYRTSPKSYMARHKAFRNPEDLSRAQDNIDRMIDEIEEARDLDFWVRNTGVCYMRQRKCPYTTICKQGLTPQVLSGFNQDEPHPELELGSALIPDGAEIPQPKEET